MNFRRRKNAGPQPDLYRKSIKNDAKVEEEVMEMIEAGMLKIFPKIEDISGIFTHKKIEEAFNRYAPSEPSIHSYDENRETDPNFSQEEKPIKVEVEPEIKTVKITKDNIQAIFEDSSLCLAKVEYTSEPD